MQFPARWGLFLATNRRILFSGGDEADEGVVRRLRVVEFPFKFGPSPRPETHERREDPTIKHEGTLRAWGPQLLLLLWCVDDLWSPKGDMRTEHMQMEPVPDAVVDATSRFLTNSVQSVVEDFLDNYCSIVQTSREATPAKSWAVK